MLVVSPPLEAVRQMALRVVESEHLELVDIEYKAGKSRSLLRIFIDKTGGVTLDDCENVSRQLSALLDVEDLLKSAYILEVSSPGLDRPFKTDRDYERSIGRFVRVHYSNEDGSPAQIAGTLKEVSDEEVVLEDRAGEHRVGRERIRRAHQDIEMPEHPGKKRKNRK
jgi:ribosome maturation factor RimP